MNSKLLGSILIIAGSSIGAGMLAMPISTAGIGFIISTLLLILLWFITYYTAILMVKVYQYNPASDGFDSLTRKYTNFFVNRIAGLSLMFLIYALTAAYMTGGGTILKTSIDSLFKTELDRHLAIILFAVLFGGIVVIGTKSIDFITKGLFSIKLVFLALLIFLMFPLVQSDNLLNLPLHQGLLLTAIPPIFTSFGFHGSIPTIVNYLGGDKKLLNKVFLYGSLLPLVIYLVWQLVVLGSLDQTSFMEILKEEEQLNGLILSIRQIAESAYIETLFSLFAAAALGTSFLGVSVGLFDYYKDLLKGKKKNLLTPLAGGLTFLPPLGFALFYPQGFIKALGFAAIAGVILALIIPTVLYIKAMQYHKQQINLFHKIAIALTLSISITIIISQFLIVFKVFQS
ncbi:aromatic amino acid transport family protein [Myroides pelagicus]|uniref:aromatic amino acid transport family protein n=1 Tax=Myroides pelagicus TaxID=270914 RepID=UPI002DBD3804|nr:aromatic amino acid transport family protein [Myroides pelagicus]MEC4113015.1 aromatic amino acid transport family protein [Myroides pelagicus]